MRLRLAPSEGTALAGEAKSLPRRPGARALVLLCCALVAAALVAGTVGAGSGDPESNVLRGFQIRVLSISQAASENRMDGALSAVQALEKDLADAAAAGRISAARYRGIETALLAVKADVTRQVAAVAPAAPTAPEAGGASTALADTADNEPVPPPVEPAGPAVAPAPAPAVVAPGSPGQDTAKEAKGKGKGGGKP